MSMEPKDLISTAPILNLREDKQATAARVAASLSDMDIRIKELLAAKERADALVKDLETKQQEELRGPKKEGEKGEVAKTTEPTNEDTTKQKAEALEKDKETNPLKYFIIKNMHDTAFSCIYSKRKKIASLEDINSRSEESGTEVKFWNFQTPSVVKHYTVFCSSNGFTLQLQNPNEVTENGKIDKHNPKAKFRLVDPNWTHNKNEGGYDLESGEKILRARAEEYQKQQEALFKEESGAI